MAIKKPRSKNFRRPRSRRPRHSTVAARQPRKVDEGKLRAEAGLSSSEELAAETAALGLEDWDEDLPVE